MRGARRLPWVMSSTQHRACRCLRHPAGLLSARKRTDRRATPSATKKPACWGQKGSEIQSQPGWRSRRSPVRPTPRRAGRHWSAAIESVWERAVGENRPHLVTVIGPPGIGKSRLSREFTKLVDQAGGRPIRGRCLPYATRDVYGAFAEQVKHVAGLFQQERPETPRAKLPAAVAVGFPASERKYMT